jgi:hypothetical protein
MTLNCIMPYFYFLTMKNIVFFLQIFDFTTKSTVGLRNFTAHWLGIPGLESDIVMACFKKIIMVSLWDSSIRFQSMNILKVL